MTKNVQQKDEGYLALQQFINDPGDDPKERARRGEIVVNIALARLEQIQDQEGLTSHALGGIIHRLRQDEAWRHCEGMSEDWRTFSSFCEEKLGMGLDKANKLERIWSRSLDIGLQPEEIEEIGWNASQYLIRIAKTRKDVDFWLMQYSSCATKKELIEKIQKALEEEREKTVPISKQREAMEERPVRRESIAMTKMQHKFYTETLEYAAARLNRELGKDIYPLECLLLIMTDWRQMKQK